MKEIKDDTNRWRDIPCSWIGRINIVKSNLQIQCNPHQITSGSFYRTRKKNLKICMVTQKTLNSQSNLEGKKMELEESDSLTQTILQSYSNQDSMELPQKQKYRPMEQVRKPRDKPTPLCQLIYDQGGNDIQWRKDSLFNKWCWI